MIDTSRAVTQEAQRVKTAEPEDIGVGSRMPIAVTMAYVQISLVVIAAYILYDSSLKHGKDSWSGMFAYIPFFIIVLISPIFLLVAGFYYYKHRKDILRHKIIVGVAVLISLVPAIIGL